MQSASGSIGLEIGACTVAFDSIAPLWNLPLELNLRLGSSLRQIDLYALARRLDVADIDQSRQRRCPQAGDRAAASVERQMIAGAFIEPARRHHPGVLATEVSFLRMRDSGLVPGMIFVHRISERIGLNECFRILPVVVVRTA